VSRLGEPRSQRTGCYLCERPTYDPDKRSRPWVRAVAGGRQVLICPQCQAERADWESGLDRCERCSSTRLSAMLGEVVCRACGTLQGLGSTDEPAEPGEPNFTDA